MNQPGFLYAFVLCCVKLPFLSVSNTFLLQKLQGSIVAAQNRKSGVQTAEILLNTG